MDNPQLIDQIEAFWNWFEIHNELLKEVVLADQHSKTEFVVQSLNQHVVGMGKIKWEIGNPASGQFNFILSPNGDKDLLKITKKIIDTAPAVESWTFDHAYPATGKPTLQIYDQNMEIHEVDSNPWKVVIVDLPDNHFDLTIAAENLFHLDGDTQIVAVDLILNALLGEERKINHIAGFEIVEALDAEEAQVAIPMSNLSFEMTP